MKKWKPVRFTANNRYLASLPRRETIENTIRLLNAGVNVIGVCGPRGIGKSTFFQNLADVIHRQTKGAVKTTVLIAQDVYSCEAEKELRWSRFVWDDVEVLLKEMTLRRRESEQETDLCVLEEVDLLGTPFLKRRLIEEIKKSGKRVIIGMGEFLSGANAIQDSCAWDFPCIRLQPLGLSDIKKWCASIREGRWKFDGYWSSFLEQKEWAQLKNPGLSRRHFTDSFAQALHSVTFGYPSLINLVAEQLTPYEISEAGIRQLLERNVWFDGAVMSRITYDLFQSGREFGSLLCLMAEHGDREIAHDGLWEAYRAAYPQASALFESNLQRMISIGLVLERRAGRYRLAPVLAKLLRTDALMEKNPWSRSWMDKYASPRDAALNSKSIFEIVTAGCRSDRNGLRRKKDQWRYFPRYLPERCKELMAKFDRAYEYRCFTNDSLSSVELRKVSFLLRAKLSRENEIAPSRTDYLVACIHLELYSRDRLPNDLAIAKELIDWMQQCPFIREEDKGMHAVYQYYRYEFKVVSHEEWCHRGRVRTYGGWDALVEWLKELS